MTHGLQRQKKYHFRAAGAPVVQWRFFMVRPHIILIVSHFAELTVFLGAAAALAAGMLTLR